MGPSENTPTTTTTTVPTTETTETTTTTEDPRHPLVISIANHWDYYAIYCGVSCGIQMILVFGLCTRLRFFVAFWILAALADLFAIFFVIIWLLGLPLPMLALWVPYYPSLDQEMLQNTSGVMT